MTRYDFLWARWVIQSHDSEQLDLIALLVNISCYLKQIVNKISGPFHLRPSILPDESALIMQVVLKIYVYYNGKLFGIFHMQWSY